MANVYRHFLDHPELPSGCYNTGFENLKIREIAQSVQSRTNAEVVITESNDPRSYRQDSSKLLATGFSPNTAFKMPLMRSLMPIKVVNSPMETTATQ